MAGSYPDAPYRRIAWDEDGTILWSAPLAVPAHFGGHFTQVITTSITEYTVPQKVKFNNEDEIGGDAVAVGSFVSNSPFMAFQMIFPEPRDLYGMAYWCNATLVDASDPRGRRRANAVEFSNSANAITGAWASLFPGAEGSSTPGITVTYPSTAPHDIYTWNHWYRIGIVPFTAIGARSFRWMQAPGETLTGSASWHHIHLYGDKSVGATPDRLLFIDMDTGLEFQAPLDWGDVPQGTTLFHDIKMFNNSASFTANDIILDYEALTGISDTWHTIRRIEGAFTGRLEIETMPPLTYYPTVSTDVLTIKLVVAHDEVPGPNASRLQAETTAWT